MIVIHEAGGLNDHIRDVTNRFAALGCVALGVDLYTREGGPPRPATCRRSCSGCSRCPTRPCSATWRAPADFLRARADVSGRLGCVGFCMGGRYTLLFARRERPPGRGDRLLGRLHRQGHARKRSTPERPTPPLELAGQLHCPLLAAVGAEDQNPSPEIATQLRERAAASGQEVKVDIYEGAGHAFFADYRPTYRPQAAAALWQQIVPFCARHLQIG